MTHQQMTLLIVLLLISVLSVGAYLLTNTKQVFVTVPDPSTLPATPLPPLNPPEFVQEDVPTDVPPPPPFGLPDENAEEDFIEEFEEEF